MKLLTEDAVLRCEHAGRVEIRASQELVRVEGRQLLVARDPEGRPIRRCPNANPPLGIRPCLTTLRVQRGYSTLLFVAGKAVCVDTLSGLTDGTPPGSVPYTVRDPGQAWLEATT